MSSTFDPTWLPLLLGLIALIFGVGLWAAISALLAMVSGYRSLGEFRIDATTAGGYFLEEEQRIARPLVAMIGPVSYRGRALSLSSSRHGLTLQISRLFPFHRPIRLPWEKVEEDPRGARLNFRPAGALLLDGRVRLRFPEATFAQVRAARHAATKTA